MPRKKTAAKSPSITRRDERPDRPIDVAGLPGKAAAPGRSAAAQRGEASTRSVKASSASDHVRQTTRTGTAAKAMPVSGKAAASRQRLGARQQGSQRRPAPSGPSEQGGTQVLEAVLAQMEVIGRDLGEVAQLRADVHLLSRRIDELTAALAGRGQDRVPAETMPPATPDSDAEPRRTPHKQRTSKQRTSKQRTSRARQRDRQLDAPDRISTEGEAGVVLPEPGPGDAVPPGGITLAPIPSESEDEAGPSTLAKAPGPGPRKRANAGGGRVRQ